MAARTKSEILHDVTATYLASIPNPKNPPTPREIESEILERIYIEYKLENDAKSDKGAKWRYPDELHPAQIAQILSYLYTIRRISCSGENADSEFDLLAIYHETGIDAGIYTTSEGDFRTLARQYDYRLTSSGFEEVMSNLKDIVPHVNRCLDPDLIAVNNGIFNYSTKTLSDFNPDTVFLTKSRVNYNPKAKNITIHNDDDNTDWDVESWMDDLSDDKEIVDVLWQILGAIIRPNVRWNKSAWLYSETGNNGKGTLCELMRSLCGAGSYASIPIADFGRDFMLEPLTRATAVIVDENDVGTYVDRAANLKAVITNDVIQINRKFKIPIAYQFYGFMVQCLNEFPRIKDKSDSFYRRQLFIPFDKCFTGHERKYIKNDYLHRKEVLEYVMYKVLNMDYYTLSEPAACKNILDEYKSYNDPIRQFFEEMSPLFQWDLLPFGFLYALYQSWFKKNAPNGGLVGKQTFINDIVNITKNDDNWFCVDKNAKVKTSNRMSLPEHLIMQYGLTDWMNPMYRGGDADKICKPALQASYRGLQRCKNSPAFAISDTDDNDTSSSTNDIDE